jgi:metal transporter CNNM
MMTSYPIELIGEEIYDEFDKEGAHADLYSAPPPVNAPALRHKNSAPQLGHDENESASGSTIVGGSMGLKNLSTIALPGLKNLNPFARSRSAPPTPRKKDKALPADGPDAEAPVPPEDTTAEQRPPGMQTEMSLPSPLPLRIIVGEGPPTPIQGENLPTATTVQDYAYKYPGEDLLAPTPIDAPQPISAIPRQVVAGALAPSRSASPSPSLELFLHERRRNRDKRDGGPPSPAPSLGPAAGAGMAPLARAASAKGGRFKSSPLTGGDLVGRVVAEQVRRDLSVPVDPSMYPSRISESKEDGEEDDRYRV